MTALRDLALLALGDSHAKFWSGRDSFSSGDTIPTVGTHMIGPVTAWHLMSEGSTFRTREVCFEIAHAARADGFQGWILLSFGDNDLRRQVYKRALLQGLRTTIEEITDRYCCCIDQLRAIYPNIAVWGPPATKPDALPNSAIPMLGSEIERNFAAMMFTEDLRSKLKMRGVPFLSLFEETLNRDGRSKWEFFFDRHHLSQRLRPLAFALVRKELGLDLGAEVDLLDFVTYQINYASDVAQYVSESRVGAQFTLQSNIYVTSLAILLHPESLTAGFHIEVSPNGHDWSTISIPALAEAKHDAERVLPIDRFARYILIVGDSGPLDPQMILINAKALHWSLTANTTPNVKEQMYRLSRGQLYAKSSATS